MSQAYDLIVIGGGPGGLAAAEATATKGKRVLIIEKDGWGGTCTHRGCIPTKALLSCSKFYADLKKLRRVGVNITSVAVDFPAMKQHQQQIVKIAALGAQKVLTDAQIENKFGVGEIISPAEVLYTDQSGQSKIMSTRNILVAWGSLPQVIPGINLSKKILTSDDILHVDFLPQSILIVGGSFIGVEYATFFAELGTKVILVELLEQILPLEDEEAAQFLHQELIRSGITIYTSTKLVNLQESDNGVVMIAQKNGGQLELQADCSLLCTGRRPLLYTDQLDKMGIRYSKTGIAIDENMMTSVPGIYAVGDVTGGMMVAHRAAKQAKVAVSHMSGESGYSYNENFIPSVVYSHPPISRVGYTQKRAEDEGMEVEVVKSNYSANIIARMELMGQGFVKAIFHQDKIIGATVTGNNAADLISPLSMAVSNELTRKQLRGWVIPHPTLSEIFIPLISS